MTQYYDDLGGYSTGGTIDSDTSGAWVTQQDGAGITYTVETDAGATAGQVLQVAYVSGTNPTKIITWETPGAQTGSVEVVGRFKVGASLSSGYTNGMLGPTLYTATNLGIGLRKSAANTIRLTRWSLTGVAASIGSSYAFADLAADTWAWVRVGRVAGSPDTFRAKIWLDSETEPGSWNISGTDATFVGVAMKAGVGNIVGVGPAAIDPISHDVFGVGTGTDSAPVADPSGGNNAPTFDGSISNLTGTEGAAITSVDVSGEFSDADDDPLTFSQTGTWPARAGGGSWVSSAGVISGTPATGSEGSYTGLKVRASDGTDTVDSDAFSFTVSAASANAPTLDGVTFPVRHGATVVLTGTNLSGAACELSYDTVAVEQTVTTTATAITIASVVSNTLPYGDVLVTATTGDGTAELVVTHRPPATRDYSVVDVPWSSGSESIFEGGVAIADGDQVDYEVLSQLGASVTVRADGTVRVATDTGLHLFDVRLWDESALEWGVMTPISVRPAGYEPGSPQFVGPNIADAALSVGDSYALDVSGLFQDTDDDIASYTLVGDWPSWFSFNTSTGIGSGIATLGDWSGVQVQANDSTGNSGLSNLFSIVVSAPPRDPATYIDRIAFKPGVVRAVGEGSVLVYTVTCLSNGGVVTPDSLRYRVEDDQGSEVLGWTDATVGTATTVVVAASYQQMRSEGNSTEWRTLTVEADYGTDYAFSDSIRYKLVNQFGI